MLQGNKQFTMRELPTSEQPYERCIKHGASSLTDAQLIAVILRSGSRDESAVSLAQRLLIGKNDKIDGLQTMFSLKYPDLIKEKGIGSVKAVTLLCAVELAKRLSICKCQMNISFSDAKSVADYYMNSISQYDKEHFYLLLLDGKNQKIKEIEISIGTVNASLASTREIMIEAIRYEAVNFIVIHNHPSGDPTPSNADICVTKKIAEAGKLLDIKLLDHIIVGNHNYCSMRSEQFLF